MFQLILKNNFKKATPKLLIKLELRIINFFYRKPIKLCLKSDLNQVEKNRNIYNR
jgi:hypothetical protein